MSWYCLVTAPQREIAAVKALQPHCQAFAPVEYRHIRTTKLKDGTAKKIVRPFPILPRYVFAQSPDWYAIRNLEFPGTALKIVANVLASDGTPHRIPQHEVMQMMHLAEHGPPKVEASRGVHPGDIVNISDGPFAGFKVKVTQATNSHARVLFKFLNGLREIELPVELLRAA